VRWLQFTHIYIIICMYIYDMYDMYIGYTSLTKWHKHSKRDPPLFFQGTKSVCFFANLIDPMKPSTGKILRFSNKVGDLSHKSGRFKVKRVIKTARFFPHVLQNDWIKYVLKRCFCGKGFKIRCHSALNLWRSNVYPNDVSLLIRRTSHWYLGQC